MALRASGAPTRSVLGLRDILDAPEVVRQRWLVEGAYDAIERYYDTVLVYGKREVFDAPVIGPPARWLGGIRVDRGTGYLGDEMSPCPRYDADQLVAATTGSEPAAVADLVRERVQRGVRTPLTVDRDEQVGQRVERVRVATMLCDEVVG